MNWTLWMRRGAAAGLLGLTVLAAASAIDIVRDLWTVNRALAEAEVSRPLDQLPTVPLARDLKPVVRLGAAAPDVAIGERLNGALGPSGLVLTSVRTVSVRPLGAGLRLAEVRVEGRGDLAAAGAVSSWVAINREAVRLKSLDAMTAPDGEARLSFVLLMVIA